MKRVLHVYPRLFRGGVEKVIENIIRFSDPALYSFEILTQEEGENEEVFSNLGIPIRRIPYVGNEAEYRQRIADLFASGGYDAVHCHGHREMSLVNLEAKAAGIPVRIAHCHSAHQDITPPKKWLRIPKFLRHSRAATDLIGCSKDALDWMFPFAGCRGRIITNGINSERFLFSPETRRELREELRCRYNISASTRIILTIGRVSPEKNHRLILEMARLSRNADRLFIIMGDGPVLDSLREEASRLNLTNLIFLGSRNDPERWLSAADVFIFPSSFEGHPLAPMEAQFAGLPVVASRIIPEETALKGSIFIKTRSMDADEWLERIAEAEMSADLSPEGRTVKSQNCRIANRDKDVRTMVKEFLQLYASERVTFCHVTPPKGITGGERYDARFEEAVKKATHASVEKYIIAGENYLNPLSSSSNSGSALPHRFAKIWMPLKAMRNLRRTIRQKRRRGEKPGAIVFNTSKCLYFLPALLLLRCSGVKTVGITHHPLYIQMKGWKRKLYEWAEMTFIRHLDFSIAASDFTRDLLQHRLPRKEVTLIPIPFEKPTPEPEKLDSKTLDCKKHEKIVENSDLIAEKWKNLGKFAKEKKELLFIGTIEPRKGLDYLLSTMTILNRNNVRVRLKVAGKVTDESYACRLRSDASAAGLEVDWLGYVDEDRKKSLFEEADIFVLPSEAEGFGIVLVEAMMAATPVVAFRNSGMTLVLGPDDERGLSATDRSPEALAEAITKLVKNHQLRIEKVRAALEWTSSLPSPIDFDREIKILCGHILQ